MQDDLRHKFRVFMVVNGTPGNWSITLSLSITVCNFQVTKTKNDDGTTLEDLEEIVKLYCIIEGK